MQFSSVAHEPLQSLVATAANCDTLNTVDIEGFTPVQAERLPYSSRA
ncbi:hypothetical protein M3J09_010596 [Ascochyta lentis]